MEMNDAMKKKITDMKAQKTEIIQRFQKQTENCAFPIALPMGDVTVVSPGLTKRQYFGLHLASAMISQGQTVEKVKQNIGEYTSEFLDILK